jgi:hypothetical protein
MIRMRRAPWRFALLGVAAVVAVHHAPSLDRPAGPSRPVQSQDKQTERQWEAETEKAEAGGRSGTEEGP